VPAKGRVFPMLEIASCPQVAVADIESYANGEISLEELFASVEDTVTGERLSPRQAKRCVAVCETFGLAGCGVTRDVEDLVAEFEESENEG